VAFHSRKDVRSYGETGIRGRVEGGYEAR